MLKHLALPTALITLALAGCQQEATSPDAPETGNTQPSGGASAAGTPAPDAPPSAAPSAASGIPSVSLAAIEEMQLADWRGANLRGEIGCGFAREGGAGPLLFATSFVGPDDISEAAVKMGGTVITLKTESRGGFDALTRGARFVGPGGLYANVLRGRELPPEVPEAAEGSRHAGQLVLSRDGQELAIDGIWSCGP